MRVATSSTEFRGFAIQARQSTESFTDDAAFMGQFETTPDSENWKIWSCGAVRQLFLIANQRVYLDNFS